ncbi:hypothetical protein PTKU15_25090 [Paraburkholderia terrae]|nr:hypothetical protein [Paraburkholderia terrae]BDC39212.1 hypothetical protein PTKU15_25090 [Paraburkholderia terrae]
MRLTGILIFFAVLCLPALQTWTREVPAFTIDENRKLADIPTLAQFADPVNGYAAIERYFDDHYGLRDILIRLKTQIDFSVFDTSDRVHIGKDGWLFYRSVLDVEKPTTERFFAANADQVTVGIQSLAAGLKARNQTLVLMPNFLGDVFYREDLPWDIPRLPQPGSFQEATQTWKALPGLIYVDSQAILWQLKQQRQIFHKTDFHWNSPAAFEVARAMVDEIGKDSGRPGATWNHPLKFEVRSYIGRESDFLPLFRQPDELGLFVVPTWDTAAVTYRKNDGIFEYVSTKTSPDSHTLPSLCVVGDSFMDAFLETGYTSYFLHVYRVRWKGAETLPAALAQFPHECRYVLVEFIETQAAAFTSLMNGARNLPLQ